MCLYVAVELQIFGILRISSKQNTTLVGTAIKQYVYILKTILIKNRI